MQDHTPESPTTKQCSQCGQIFPATSEYFFNDNRRAGKLHASCKLCRLKYNANNRERILEGLRRYYAANKDRINAKNLINRDERLLRRRKNRQKYKAQNAEYMRRYHEEHREEIAARRLKYRTDNSDWFLERQRYIRASNIEAARERERKWAARNKERISAKYRRWRQNNVEAARAKDNRRRARKATAEGNYSGDDVKRQYKGQKGKCYYCGIKVGKTYHVDHVVPLSRGGSNRPENIVIACPTCNQSKKDKMPHEWAGSNRLL